MENTGSVRIIRIRFISIFWVIQRTSKIFSYLPCVKVANKFKNCFIRINTTFYQFELSGTGSVFCPIPKQLWLQTGWWTRHCSWLTVARGEYFPQQWDSETGRNWIKILSAFNQRLLSALLWGFNTFKNKHLNLLFYEAVSKCITCMLPRCLPNYTAPETDIQQFP